MDIPIVWQNPNETCDFTGSWVLSALPSQVIDVDWEEYDSKVKDIVRAFGLNCPDNGFTTRSTIVPLYNPSVQPSPEFKHEQPSTVIELSNDATLVVPLPFDSNQTPTVRNFMGGTHERITFEVRFLPEPVINAQGTPVAPENTFQTSVLVTINGDRTYTMEGKDYNQVNAQFYTLEVNGQDKLIFVMDKKGGIKAEDNIEIFIVDDVPIILPKLNISGDVVIGVFTNTNTVEEGIRQAQEEQ